MYIATYYKLIVVFFPSFDRFIPSFDRIILGFDNSSLLAFLLLEPSPTTIKCTFINKCALFCILLSFYLILIEMNTFSIKKNISISRTNIFLRSTVDTNPRLSPSHFNATGCPLWSIGSDNSQLSVVNIMQGGCYTNWSNWIYHEILSRHSWSDSTKTHLTALKSMGNPMCTVYPKKYAHGFCFAVHCCGYTLTDFPISIRLTSLALWQSNDCPSASKATLMNMDK